MALLLSMGSLERTIASAAGSVPPVGPEDFIPTGAEGDGDRQNGWTWSMVWYKNNLYVGSNRAFGCVTQASYADLNPGTPYPPSDPDLDCTADPSDLPLRAEIWRWSPLSNIWARAYQSPNNIPNPSPTEVGKFLPPDIGFRSGMEYFDPQDKDWMMFGGVSANALGVGRVSPPELLYSDDGATFAAVPHDSGTFLGDLPNTSFRSLTQYNDQVFVINGSIQGAGPIIASKSGTDPLSGNDAWAQATPGSDGYYQMAVYNGWLYAGLVDIANGYSVVKTQANGDPPYTWVPVVTHGGYKGGTPAQYPITMVILNGRLYVGTANLPEEIRINADDTWDLVVGDPRQMPDGSWKYPLSGLGEGFDNDFEGEIWREGIHNGQLFLGTYDNSIRYKGDPAANQILTRMGLSLGNRYSSAGYPDPGSLFGTMGFDLFRTDDGWRMTNLTTTGFNNEFDYGVRNFQDTPYGMFFGSANEYYGLQIYRGQDGPSTRLPAPGRVDLEMSHNQPVLTWDRVPGASSYHVFRAHFSTVTLATTAIEPGGTYRFPGAFAEITPVGGIVDTVFVDGVIQTTDPTYEYVVTATDLNGNSSDSSNLALAPSFLPATTYTDLLDYVALEKSRGVFVSPDEASSTLQQIQTAQADTARGDLSGALRGLQALDSQDLNANVLLFPDMNDFDIMLARLERRLKLANSYLVDLQSLQ
jgi:hypothetical protein